MNFLLSTAYLPPISYFSLFFQDIPVTMDGWENFQKQSFRNRAYILSPQGTLCLTVPIQKFSRRGIPLKEVKISNEDRWQRLHWMTLHSCYRRSTYFEYFEEKLIPFFEKKYSYIWDLNLEWMEYMGQIYELDLNKWISFTENYHKDYLSDWIDLRNEIHPKKIKGIQGLPYTQVFSAEGTFREDISILDLLFNTGKSGILQLRSLGELSKLAYLEKN